MLHPGRPRSREEEEGSHVTVPGLSQQVLIFAEKKADVDAIHEYLLLKGVEAVAIHGGKGQGAYLGFSKGPIAPGLISARPPPTSAVLLTAAI